MMRSIYAPSSLRQDSNYFCFAQAYMLISMPTGTSTILGVVQAIRLSSYGVAAGRLPATL
jgi:hypothetical protein